MTGEIKQSKRGGKRPGAGRKPKGAAKGKPLKNARHERFAQGLAEGKSKSRAYEEAGYEPHAGNATRLSGNEKVKARIEELKQAIIASVIARTAASREYVLEALVDTLERCRQAAPVLDRKGDIVMVETATGELVPAYVFDAKSVLRSAELIGKEIGMFVERTENTHVVRDITDEPVSETEWADRHVTAH